MTDPDEFIAELYPAAAKIARETGMSKELILAQAAQETGWGQHVLNGTHNIFNIKASADWDGPTKTFRVWEIENGHKVWKDQEFRVYASTEEALRDRIRFLRKNPRYTKTGLFDEGTKGDFHKEAAALQKAGYATDPLYARHLIAVYNGPTMQRAIQHAQAQEGHDLLKQGNHGTPVRTLQSRLAGLGYTDTHGHLLKADGDFGPDTRYAVEAFQHDHHLSVDGKVGHDTQAALQTALRPGSSVGLDDERNPDHVMYQQALVGVHHAEARRGVAPGLHSERLAAALVVVARSEGFTHIDGVVLSGNGLRAFVEQKGGIPSVHDKIASADTAQAIHTPIARSAATLAAFNQRQPDPANAQALPPPTPETAAPGLAH